jgi:hypothetical protein
MRVDLGPDLSVTGSLATILWRTAIRREQVDIAAWESFKLAVIAMPFALVACSSCGIDGDMPSDFSGLDHRQMICDAKFIGSQVRYLGNKSPLRVVTGVQGDVR